MRKHAIYIVGGLLSLGLPAVAFAAPRTFQELSGIIVNLLNNAVAATSKAGEIEIVLACEEERNVVILEVRDNGAGVSDQDKLRLFEPYFSRKKTGTGLGLAIASTVVADHHGYIRVKDNEPQGARFIIELPLNNG